MASATKKKPPARAGTTQSGKAKATRAVGKTKAPARAVSKRSTNDDIDEPERSAPPLAEVDADALEFIEAIDRFKKQNGRPFPSWSEVLLVLRQLGYRRP